MSWKPERQDTQLASNGSKYGRALSEAITIKPINFHWGWENKRCSSLQWLHASRLLRLEENQTADWRMLSSASNVLMTIVRNCSFLKVSSTILISQDIKLLLVRFILSGKCNEEEHRKSPLSKFRVSKIWCYKLAVNFFQWPHMSFLLMKDWTITQTFEDRSRAYGRGRGKKKENRSPENELRVFWPTTRLNKCSLPLAKKLILSLTFNELVSIS